MLGKLLRNELKATGRLFLILYALLALMTGFYKVSRLLPTRFVVTQSIMVAVSTALYVVIVVGVVAMSFVIMVQRFYKNLLGDEGYLMHTLPVTAGQHILAKLMVSLLWNVLSFALVLLSVALLAANPADWGRQWAYIVSLIEPLAQEAGFNYATLLLYAAIWLFVVAVDKTLLCYASLSLGQWKASKNKLGAAIGFAALLYMLEQVVPLLILRVVEYARPGWIIQAQAPAQGIVRFMFWWSVCASAVCAAVYACVSNRALKKHLNLA
ncbi:MAG: hypothetical protein LBU67_09715 [Oscillospiraceae bacterium]|jgi:hypothetical protein|nr:hypothetical protein [Oscillospiraceae bacterium]